MKSPGDLVRYAGVRADSERDYARPMKALVAVCVVACAGGVAHSADCLAREDAASRTEATDKAIVLCFDAGGCWAFDLAARQWGPHAPLPADTAQPAKAAEPKTTANIHVCAPDGTDCREIDLPGAWTFGNLETLQTPDRARVAILGQGSSVYVYDGATRRLVVTIPPWKSKYDPDGNTIRGGAFVGGNLAIYEASSPVSDEVRLFDGATGKQLAIIAPAIIGDPIELGGGDWAFPREDGDVLIVASAKTGKLRTPISLPGPGVTDSTRGSSVAFRTTDKQLFLAARGDAASGIVVYDLATKQPRRYLPPLCPK